ncbi:MAG: TIM barrel protein [Candidatus Hydrothermales bacterium]
MKKILPIQYEKLYIGTAGVPESAKDSSTESGIIRINELKLDSMEVEFVKGVKIKEERAAKIKDLAKETKVFLSVHAPYFINLNSKEKQKFRNSIKYIYDSAKIGYLMGAYEICFHSAYMHDENLKTVRKKVKDALLTIFEMLDKENIRVRLRPETMGKPSQYADLVELLELSTEFKGEVEPCLDFAHLYARSLGKINSYEEFMKLVNHYEEALGKDSLKRMHIHISGMEYTEKGEKKHLVFKDSKFKFKEVLKVLKEKDIKGFLICESPSLEDDALILKREYLKILKKGDRTSFS